MTAGLLGVCLTSAPAQDFSLQRVFPQLSFSQPTDLTELPNGTNRLVVLEKTGHAQSFPRTADPAPGEVQTFYDLRGQVSTTSERGLLAIAFDPDYATNGEFYLHYSPSVTSGDTRISRFTDSDPSDGTAAGATEEIILEVDQPFSNHNGGSIHFGPDGMLYIALGDGGSGGDPQGNGQNSTTLLGSILRLDVRGTSDPGLAYAIPDDNPFVGGGPAGPATREEIFAWGLRNPFRMSFDMVTGELFAADVGQNCIEEVDHIVSGANYGWNEREGDQCYQPGTCNPTISCSTAGFTEPIATYGRGEGSSITGGYVYYGDTAPTLHSHYLYGDFGSGRLWAIPVDENGAAGPAQVLISNTGLSIVTFGQTLDGEVYIVHFGGEIYRIDGPQPAPVEGWVIYDDKM